MWCQERFKVAIQQLTDGKVISSRIHTCTHRRGEGISLISYDSTSTGVEGFTASGLSNTTGFHARTSFQLAFSSCTIETLDGVAWLSLACTQGVVSILWGIVERVEPPWKWAAGSSNSCQGWRVSADLLRPSALLVWGITVLKSGEHTAHVSGSWFQLDPGNLNSRRWMSLASLQPFMVLKCLQFKNEQPHIHPQLPSVERSQMGLSGFPAASSSIPLWTKPQHLDSQWQPVTPPTSQNTEVFKIHPFAVSEW